MELLEKKTKTSTYKSIVSKLKDKSEAELQLLYNKLFADDLKKEWKAITQKSSFGKLTEKQMLAMIKKSKR